MNVMDLTREALHRCAGSKPGRFEVGKAVYDWLVETVRHEGVRDESPWRPVGAAPPPDFAQLWGVSLVLREDLDPAEWRLLDVDGDLIESGMLMDAGVIPDTRPPVRYSLRFRVRWRISDIKMAVRLRVGAWIAGVDFEGWRDD